jgi:hypothetical protein
MIDRQDQSVSKRASSPDGELACDFEIAGSIAETGFRERLGAAMIGQPRTLEDGVEVTFRDDAWDLVLQYVETESQCCPFLNLAARKRDDTVVLTVTGRQEAQPIIRQIFAANTAESV